MPISPILDSNNVRAPFDTGLRSRHFAPERRTVRQLRLRNPKLLLQFRIVQTACKAASRHTSKSQSSHPPWEATADTAGCTCGGKSGRLLDTQEIFSFSHVSYITYLLELKWLSTDRKGKTYTRSELLNMCQMRSLSIWITSWLMA